MAITPTREQITDFLKLDLEGEIVMLNLLKYKAKASDEEGAGDEAGTGEGAYGRYADKVRKMVEERGGRAVWIGRAKHTLIGDPDDDSWDVVALIAYPSRDAFIEMTSGESYKEAHKSREAGLDRTALICMQASNEFASDR